MSQPIPNLLRANRRAVEHVRRLVQTIAARDHEFVRAYAVRFGVPQHCVRLHLERCWEDRVRFSNDSAEAVFYLPIRGRNIRLEIPFQYLRTKAVFAAWVIRQTKAIQQIDQDSLLRHELNARSHARQMAKLRKADRAAVIARADKVEGKAPSI